MRPNGIEVDPTTVRRVARHLATFLVQKRIVE